MQKAMAKTFIFVAILLSFGCQNVTLPGAGGSLVEFDKNGYAMENLIYNQGSTVATFNADGTFEIDYFGTVTSTQTTVPAAQTGGDKGTYVYNPDTFKLTKTYLKRYDVASTSWVDYNSTTTESSGAVESIFFAEHCYGQVFTPDNAEAPTSWSCEIISNYADTSNSYSQTTTQTYKYAVDGTTFTYTRKGIKVTTDNTVGFTVRDDTTSGTYASYPESQALSADAIVTYRVLPAVYNTNIWTSDSTAALVLTTTTGNLNYMTWTFYNDGTHIYSLPSSMSRALN